MEPTLKEGDFVLVYKWATPKIGDIIAFGYEGKVLVKRITSIKNSHYLVSGDNKTDSRNIPKIKKEQVIGKVI